MYTQRLLKGAAAGLATSPLAFAGAASGQAACTADAIASPDLFGAEILDLAVAERNNQTMLSDDGAFPANLTVSYCGVNVLGLVVPINDGYSAAYTDGGHSIESANAASPANWALLSPGNLNYPLLQDFAAVALADMALLGKAITESYYGQKPDYSYWTGCSTGGRQGLMLAQRYPDLYDGIVALAPAVNWDTFLVTEFWVQQFMNELGAYPPPCEIEAFTKAAVTACDKLDGLEDGVISNATACQFDPHSVVGTHFSCGNDTAQFTHEGALVVEAAWTGPIDSQGTRQWYGLGKDANLSALVQTVPATGNSSAKGVPQMYAPDWIKYFVAKDPDLDIGNLSNEEYFRILHLSRNEFRSILGTSDPDLSPFKARGGKMITWHGLADQLIFPNGSVDYYQRVSEEVSDVQDFYRFFEAPGVAHCSGGAGAQPVGELEALVQWVEHGVAPETLAATNVTLNGAKPGPGESLPKRKICAWPKEQKYSGGDPLVAESFDCV